MKNRSKITHVCETLLEWVKTEDRNDYENQLATSANNANLNRASNYLRLARLLLEFLDENP